MPRTDIFLRLSLRQVELLCHIGVTADERSQPQVVLLDLDFELGEWSSTRDLLEDTSCYVVLSNALVQEARRRPRALMETLGVELLDVCFLDPRVHQAKVTLHKKNLYVAGGHGLVTLSRYRIEEAL